MQVHRRNPISDTLTPANDPIIQHLQKIENAARQALEQTDTYRDAVNAEAADGIEASADVFAHRVVHQTTVAVRLLEAAAAWFIDPIYGREQVEMLNRKHPNDEIGPKVRALCKLLTDEVDAEEEMLAECQQAEEKARRQRFRVLPGGRDQIVREPDRVPQ